MTTSRLQNLRGRSLKHAESIGHSSRRLRSSLVRATRAFEAKHRIVCGTRRAARKAAGRVRSLAGDACRRCVESDALVKARRITFAAGDRFRRLDDRYNLVGHAVAMSFSSAVLQVGARNVRGAVRMLVSAGVFACVADYINKQTRSRRQPRYQGPSYRYANV